jgi:hypothetical protein
VISPIVLCDPGLLVPPARDDVATGVVFWPRLVEWSADRRVRLGPATQQCLVTALGDIGWPDFAPPGCPTGLRGNASRALHALISRVASLEVTDKELPTLDPLYSGPIDAASSIGSDASALDGGGLVGLATDTAHWSSPADAVKFDPPPPDLLPFVLQPGQRLTQERDKAVATLCSERKITIVGGLFSEHVMKTLRHRFSIDGKQVKWLVAERNQDVNLDALSGVRREADIVFCITEPIGHDTWQAARRQCRRRGVELHEVRRVNEIADSLCSRYGDTDI